MASSIEIINAEKNGARMHLKALINGGANINTFRNGVRVKEHFLHTEPLKLNKLEIGARVQRDNAPSRTGTVTNKSTLRFAIDNGKNNQNPNKWSVIGETKRPARNRSLLRQNTVELDESCSRFFEEELPDLRVKSSTAFEIEGNEYKVIGKLGEGTYGLVIKARDVSNNRDVAVKFMFGDEQNKEKQQTELAMQYYLSCMLENKPPPSGSALVPTIYTIANLVKQTKTLKILKEKNITSSLVGVMELLGKDLETLLIKTSDDAKKIPIVQQVLKEVAQTLEHVNNFSTKPVFVHGDLHTGNAMYTKKKGEYRYYIMDLGLSEIDHYGGRTESPNPDMYLKRTRAKWRHRGTQGNDLCMLCLSIVQMFEKARLDDLPELFRPILDYFKTTPPGDLKHYVGLAEENKQELPLENALEIFLDESSAFYLGCDPREGRWPLGKDEDGKNLPLFHYFGYDMVDEDSDVTDIFAPGHFLHFYLNK